MYRPTTCDAPDARAGSLPSLGFATDPFLRKREIERWRDGERDIERREGGSENERARVRAESVYRPTTVAIRQ